MKYIISSIVSAVLLATVAFAGDLNEPVNAAFAQKETKFVDVDGHNFHIKPITVVVGKQGKVASGLISHHLGGRPDDQISYKVTVKDGENTKYEIKIARGGVEEFLPIPKKMKGKTGRIIDGAWEPSCQRIIDVVAAKLELQ